MLTDYRQTFTSRLRSEFLAKLNIPPNVQSIAILPCEMSVLKIRHAPELSGTNCHTKFCNSKQLLKKYSFNDVSTILLTDEKDIYSGHTKNPKESSTVRSCSNQEERCHDKMPAHMSNVQTSVGKSQVVKKTPV